MASVKVTGLKSFIRKLEGSPRLLRQEKDRLFKNLGEKLRRYVRRNLEGPYSQTSGSAGNLMSRFHSRKTTRGRTVGFDPYKVTAKHVGKTVDVVRTVEEGARPHMIPIPSVKKSVMHPGFVGKHFWKRSMDSLERNDLSLEIEKSADRIVRNLAK